MIDQRFVEALVAPAVAAEIPEEQRIFEPFIGSWHLTVDWFDEAGNVARSRAGEWHFGRVLEGRAVQDVWIVPSRRERGRGDDYEYGTSLRFYDPLIAAWRSTWIGPARGWIMRFIARRRGAEVVLENPDEHGFRWAFYDISPDRFAWRNELRSQAGHWQLQQRFLATRMTGA